MSAKTKALLVDSQPVFLNRFASRLKTDKSIAVMASWNVLLAMSSGGAGGGNCILQYGLGPDGVLHGR